MQKLKLLYYDSLLLVVAIIWGVTFSFQKEVSESIPAFTFNASRFAIGAIVMLGFVLIKRESKWLIKPNYILNGAILGFFLFGGNAFQQYGIEFTSVANAGFITTLYVLIVPIFLYLGGKKLTKSAWIAALIATLGLYLLSGANPAETQSGDLFQLAGTLFWAGHITYIGRVSKRVPLLILNFWQIFFCALFSFIGSRVISEIWRFEALFQAWEIIVFSGFISMGLCLYLQSTAQKQVSANNTAIILSLEGLFAALFGWWLLGEVMGNVAMIGGFLITLAAIYSQLSFKTKPKNN